MEKSVQNVLDLVKFDSLQRKSLVMLKIDKKQNTGYI